MRYLIIVLFLFSTSVFACEDEAYKQAVEDAGEYQDEADGWNVQQHNVKLTRHGNDYD